MSCYRAIDPDVRVIGRAGVGLDTIDLEAAKSLGITVFNEPSYAPGEVASHAIGMIITLQRKLVFVDNYVRNGWADDLVLAPMKPMDEIVVGLVGCGRIGRSVVEQLGSMVNRILVFDPMVTELPPSTVRVDSLEELLSQSDVVSLHLPLTTQTAGMLGRAQLEMMPVGLYPGERLTRWFGRRRGLGGPSCLRTSGRRRARRVRGRAPPTRRSNSTRTQHLAFPSLRLILGAFGVAALVLDRQRRHRMVKRRNRDSRFNRGGRNSLIWSARPGSACV